MSRQLKIVFSLVTLFSIQSFGAPDILCRSENGHYVVDYRESLKSVFLSTKTQKDIQRYRVTFARARGLEGSDAMTWVMSLEPNATFVATDQGKGSLKTDNIAGGGVNLVGCEFFSPL